MEKKMENEMETGGNMGIAVLQGPKGHPHQHLYLNVFALRLRIL